MPRRKGTRGQRSVGPPADVWSVPCSVKAASPQEAEVQKKSAKRGEPKTEGIQPWEGHVASADHQRHEVVGKAKDHGYAHEEDHGRAMHGEHAVEDLW